MADYRNWQLLTSGFIGGTNQFIDNNLDPTYEIFKVCIFNLSITPAGAFVLEMSINGDGSPVYTNMDGLTTSVILAPESGTHLPNGNYSTELLIYCRNDGASPIYINGFATYLSTVSSLMERYQIGAVYAPSMPAHSISSLRFVSQGGDQFNTGTYVSYGVNARGASLLFTSNFGG